MQSKSKRPFPSSPKRLLITQRQIPIDHVRLPGITETDPEGPDHKERPGSPGHATGQLRTAYHGVAQSRQQGSKPTHQQQSEKGQQQANGEHYQPLQGIGRTGRPEAAEQGVQQHDNGAQ